MMRMVGVWLREREEIGDEFEGDVVCVCKVAAHNGKEEEYRELGFLGPNYQIVLLSINIYLFILNPHLKTKL